MIRLSEGSIAKLSVGDTVDSPVLQVLSYKKIPNQGSDRYRLLISDGIHIHGFAMLATQMNDLIDQGKLESNTIIKVNKFVCNSVSNQAKGEKKVLIVLDLQIMVPGSEVSKIGNPLVFDPSTASAAPAAPKPTPQPSMNYSRPTPTPAASAPSSASGNVLTFPISSLTPYQNKWTIKARVTNKSALRTYSNARGEGKLFSVDLADESGEIRATAFNKEVDKYYDMLQMNKVYYISKCTLKPANKQYSSIKNDYEMTFGSETQVMPCLDDTSSIPSVCFNFVPIKELQQVNKDAIIDILGVVRSCGDVVSFVSKAQNREMKKRELVITDETNTDVNLTLWGKQAEDFDGSLQPVIAAKGVKVSDFGGRSLSTLMSSTLQVNPDIPEAHRLKGWFDNVGSTMQSTNLSAGRGATTGGMGGNFKTFGEVKAEQLGTGDKPDYFLAKATVVALKKDNALYMACPSADCNKKVNDFGNTGTYRCEKCQRDYQEFKWRLMLQANFMDFTDHQWVTIFQENAETILGRSAEELGSLQSVDPDAYGRVFADATFTSHLVKLRVKMETYQDENRLKCTMVETKPIVYSEYNKMLLSEIKKIIGQ